MHVSVRKGVLKLKKIGWIGLGNMGMPMCQNLIKAGYPAVVNDMIKEKVQSVLDMGAEWADTPREVAEKADYIFTMLPNGKILRSVTDGENGISAGITPGKIMIDMSTISAAESVAVAELIEEKGSRLLRCPVTGSTGPAAKGLLGLLISGDPEIYDEVEPLLNCLGKNKYWLGEKEEARVMKIALNTMVGNTAQLLAEAVSLAEKAGIAVDKCMDVIGGSAVGSFVVQSKVDLIKNNAYEPAFSVRMMQKDFDLAMDTAKQYEASLPVTALVRQFYEEATACGKAGEDYAVLVQRQEKNVGIDR